MPQGIADPSRALGLAAPCARAARSRRCRRRSCAGTGRSPGTRCSRRARTARGASRPGRGGARGPRSAARSPRSCAGWSSCPSRTGRASRRTRRPRSRGRSRRRRRPRRYRFSRPSSRTAGVDGPAAEPGDVAGAGAPCSCAWSSTWACGSPAAGPSCGPAVLEPAGCVVTRGCRLQFVANARVGVSAPRHSPCHRPPEVARTLDGGAPRCQAICALRCRAPSPAS